MSVALAGFVKGFTGRTLDNIDERRRLEAEEKKARMLAQLQMETEQANILFRENTPTAKLGRAKDEQAMRLADEAAVLARDKFTLDRQQTLQTMDLAKRKEARESLDSAAQRDYYNRAGRSGTGQDSDEVTPSAVVDSLKSRYSSTINKLVEDGVNPLDIDRAAAQYVELVRGRKEIKGLALEQGFLAALQSLQTRSNK